MHVVAAGEFADAVGDLEDGVVAAVDLASDVVLFVDPHEGGRRSGAAQVDGDDDRLAVGELRRVDAKTRAETYEKAGNPATGWLQLREVRELEDLPPETQEAA